MPHEREEQLNDVGRNVFWMEKGSFTIYVKSMIYLNPVNIKIRNIIQMIHH